MSSGIHRYDTSLLTCLGEYKDYPDITASEIKYLHGNGQHLCVVTASGVNYIDTYTDFVIETDTVYALKTLSSTVDTSINQMIEVVYKDTLNNINDTVYYQNSLWFYANYKFPEDIMTIRHRRTYDTLNLYSFTRIKY
jgi:hypothetical protein